MTQTQAAWIVLVTVIVTSVLSVWIKYHGRIVMGLAVVNILNIVVLQWILGWYFVGTLVALGVLAACVGLLRTELRERSAK